MCCMFLFKMEMQEETGNANLLDWEDVNEELEFMHKVKFNSF